MGRDDIMKDSSHGFGRNGWTHFGKDAHKLLSVGHIRYK
jgi:hypothetical protein